VAREDYKHYKRGGRIAIMPPSAVKTIRDLIYWQYGKLISESAGAGKKQYAFIMNRYKELQSGQIGWSGAIREYIREREMPNQCVYCGSQEHLSVDHLIAQNRNGPDIPENAVMACRTCNSSKGDKGVYEWFKKDRRDEIPRIAEGKYLKLLYKLHEEKGTLDSGRENLQTLCDGCEVGYLCEESVLTVYCLESVLRRIVVNLI
jgi:5-methylcytosine-specific restriction endonuclease McrA